MNECELRKANGSPHVACEEGRCVFWKVFEHLDAEAPAAEGCAVQYFDLLVEGDSSRAAWLLSVKTRIECAADPVE